MLLHIRSALAIAAAILVVMLVIVKARAGLRHQQEPRWLMPAFYFDLALITGALLIRP